MLRAGVFSSGAFFGLAGAAVHSPGWALAAKTGAGSAGGGTGGGTAATLVTGSCCGSSFGAGETATGTTGGRATRMLWSDTSGSSGSALAGRLVFETRLGPPWAETSVPGRKPVGAVGALAAGSGVAGASSFTSAFISGSFRSGAADGLSDEAVAMATSERGAVRADGSFATI